MKAEVTIVPCAIRAAAVGITFVGVPEPKPMHGFSPNFQHTLTLIGPRAD